MVESLYWLFWRSRDSSDRALRAFCAVNWNAISTISYRFVLCSRPISWPSEGGAFVRCRFTSGCASCCRTPHYCELVDKRSRKTCSAAITAAWCERSTRRGLKPWHYARRYVPKKILRIQSSPRPATVMIHGTRHWHVASFKTPCLADHALLAAS